MINLSIIIITAISCLYTVPCCASDVNVLTLLLGAHLGRERKWQTITVHVVRISRRRRAWRNLQRVFLQDAAHLPLHALRPGNQVGLRALSGLDQPLLSADEGRQLLQVVIELVQDWVGSTSASLVLVALSGVEPWRGLA